MASTRNLEYRRNSCVYVYVYDYKSRLIPMQCVVVLQYNASDTESVIDLHDIIAH